MPVALPTACDDRDHLTAQADARIGRAGGRAADDHGQGRDQQQVEDDDHVGHRAEGGEVEHRDEQLQHDQRGKADQRGRKENALVRGGGDDGLLAAELEEIIEGLEQRGADALLHPGDDLAVDAGEEQTDKEAEQEARENEDVAEGL